MPSRGRRSPFPGWESSWSLVSALGAPFLLASRWRERLWCGGEGSPHPGLLPSTHITAPQEAGAAAPACPAQSWFKTLIPSKAQPFWLRHIHGAHGCLAGPGVQESSPFPGSGFLFLERKKYHLSSAGEGEFLGRVALRCLRTWWPQQLPWREGCRAPLSGRAASSTHPRPQVHPSPSMLVLGLTPGNSGPVFQLYFQECSAQQWWREQGMEQH